MATGCTLPKLPRPRVLAARLLEGDGLLYATEIQLGDLVEVGAGPAEGRDEGLSTEKENGT